MPSNLITPPDIVSEKNINVLLINAETNDVYMVSKILEQVDKDYNVYVYSSGMSQVDWLNQVIDLADAIIVNADYEQNLDLLQHESTFYYGQKTYFVPAHKIVNPLHYFAPKIT